MNAISLFTNCGAGDLGFKAAGFNFKILAELEQKRLDVAKLNHPRSIPICGDLTSTWEEVVNIYREKFLDQPLSLLTACPPCQGFSSARGLRGKKGDAQSGMFDNRNILMTVIPKVALELKPAIIVIENVPAFLSRQLINPTTGEDISGANYLIESLSQEYIAFPMSSDLGDFGIPQTRKRSVIVFISLEKTEILAHLKAINSVPFPIPKFDLNCEKGISVKEYFQSFNIPQLTSEKGSNSDLNFHELHEVSVLEKKYVNIINDIPKNSGTSAWYNNTCPSCSFENIKEDVKCQKCKSLLHKPIIKIENKHRLISGFNTSYKRMNPDKPASTVLTASGSISSHNTIHPYEDRVLSPYECQILQTFPEDFRWGETKEKYSTLQIRKMIGEAVPPKFTRLHGRILYSLLQGNLRGRMMKASDKRLKRAIKSLNE